MTKVVTDEKNLTDIFRYAHRLEQLHADKQFHAKQREVMDAIFKKGYKRIFIRKGRKGGGTETLLYPACRVAGLFPGSACYIVGPTRKLEDEILWENQRLLRFFPKEWGVIATEQDSRITIPHPEGHDSFVKVDGANNWKDMAGWEADVLVFDEFKDQDPRAYQEAYPNLAARDGILVIVGAPPNTRDSFYFRLEQDAKSDPNWFCINWSIWDNPFLPGGKEWIENEKKQYYARGDWDLWENLYEARYVFGGKRTVLSRFRRETHSMPHEILMSQIRGDKSKLKWLVSCDPGYATCFAVTFQAYNPYTMEYYFLDEIYETNRSKLNVSYLWPLIEQKKKDLYPDGKWTHLYDVAATGFPNEVRSRYGNSIHFRPTLKEKDDEDKWFRVWNGLFDDDLSQNRCWVSDRCSSLMTEMENYVTDENGKYPPGGEHALDTGRYGIKMNGYKPREKQDDIVIAKHRIAVSLEQGLREKRITEDWAQNLLNLETNLEDWQ